MTTHYFELSATERRDVLAAVAADTGYPPTIIEKDVWVCWSLAEVFSNSNAMPMAFKGGTSLSKVFGAINRFSEDLDITLGLLHADEKLPSSRNQRDKRSEQIRQHVAIHVGEVIMPHLMKRASDINDETFISFDGVDVLRIQYASCLKGANGYIMPQVLLEFGGRNRIVPSEWHPVVTHIERSGITLLTPSASVNVLSPIRTFWEKVTLAHAECSRHEWRRAGDRFARHWSDLAALADHQIGERALADRVVLEDVVRVKTAFWSSASANYELCLTGKCQLVPTGDLLVGLRRDYQAMVSAGMFAKTPPTFEVVIQRVRDLESRINDEFTRRPGTD